MADEFAIIDTYFLPLTEGNPAALGLKDDAAVLDCPPGKQIVISKDVLVEGVHFFHGDDPTLLAKKALRTNLSDIAVMGATPMGYFLGMVLPKQVKESWISRFCEGLRDDNQNFDVALLGGDTTSHEGDIIISVTVIGTIPRGKAIKRGGARVGDKIYVSGTIGDSALGLHLLKNKEEDISSGEKTYLLSRYYVPLPRVNLGRALRGIATSCMDISDGLVQDLGHITECSGVGAEIHAVNIPLSEAALTFTQNQPSLMEKVLTGGDDYELLFTIPPAKERELAEITANLGVSVTCIGAITQEKGVVVYGEDGTPMQFKQTGYRHF